MKKTLSFILLWLIYGELHSATLRIAVPENLPPYIYPQNNNHSKPGFEIEIALEALSNFDYQVEFVYVPLSRLSYMLNTDRVDGALTISDALSAPNTCLTAPYISYQNIAISLAKNNFYIKELADLANKRIIAFQNATHYLDPAFSAAIISSPDYREMRNQELQVKNLFLERTDLLIMDINIFEYFHRSNKTYNKSIQTHKIFPVNNYKASFLNKKLCREFDLGIKNLRDSGRYQHIIDSYSNHKNQI